MTRLRLVCAIFFLPILSVISASSSITSVDPADLDFTAEQIRPGSDDPIPEFDATGDVRRISFQGAVQTPVPCYEIGGGIETDGDRVTLVVTSTPQDVVCIQVLATFAYEGTVGRIEPGFHEVAIVHVLCDDREVVFQELVEVE